MGAPVWFGRRTLVLLALIVPFGCSSNSAGPSRSVTSVQISGPSVLYGEPGEAEAYTATATWSDGSTADETLTATWTSSDSRVVEALSSGHVVTAGAGTVTIAAAVNGTSGILSVQVTPPDWRFVGTPTLSQVDMQTEFLGVDPRDETTLYVGTLHGLYVTHNGGGSWLMPVTGFIDAIAIDPTNPDWVYTIANAHELRRSTNRGESFELLQMFDDAIRSIRVSVATHGTLYIGFGGYQNPNPSGVFKSTDNGGTWEREPFGVSGALIVWSVAEDATDGTLYAGTEIADHPQPYHPPFFRSTDRGHTWVDATGNLPWHVTHISVNSTTHAVYALTEGPGLFRSVDQATNWTAIDTHFGLSLLLDPQNLNHLFGGDIPTGIKNGGAFISTNGGTRFVSFGLEGREVADLALNGTSSRLYATCYGSGIYVTNVGPLSATVTP
jgi:hypothetical protein